MSTPARTFARGCLIAGLPLLLLFLPLLAHRSDAPVIATYSRAYLQLLAVVAAGIVTVTLLVGWRCRRTGGREPAYGLVLLLVGAVLAAGVLEMFLTYRLRLEDAFSQYRAWGHQRSMLFAFEAEPDHRWVNADATYTTDHYGFRTHARGPWDASSTTRIFTLGESAVFGYGLNDDQTWAHLLEGALRERRNDPSLTVVNAGNNGYTSLQTLFRFHVKVLPLRPTHLILYLGPNDVYAGDPTHLLISEDILFSGSVAAYWAAATRGKNLYSRTLLFYVAQRHLPGLAPKTLATTPAPVAGKRFGQREAEEIGAGLIENVRTVCLVSRAHGIEPVLATFIHALSGDAPFPPLALRHINGLLRSFAEAEGVRLIDLEAAFQPLPDKPSYFFADRYHPSRRGAAFIATTIADAW
jgi:lysophospholipase L1-like esterase